MEEKKQTNSQIFIAKLHPRVTSQDLKYKFSKCGNIKDIRVKPGYAFIVYKKLTSSQDFEQSDEAEKAVERMNGKELEGQRIVVEISSKNKHINHVPHQRGSIKRRTQETTEIEIEEETEVIEETEEIETEETTETEEMIETEEMTETEETMVTETEETMATELTGLREQREQREQKEQREATEMTYRERDLSLMTVASTVGNLDTGTYSCEL